MVTGSPHVTPIHFIQFMRFIRLIYVTETNMGHYPGNKLPTAD